MRAFVLLFTGLLFSTNALAQLGGGCLPTSTGTPINWTLPSTPGTPNWTLNASGYTIDGFPPLPDSVPFSATFWRRPECPTQLIMTLDVTKPVLFFGAFSLFQGGYSTNFLYMTVNNPAVFGLNVYPLVLPPSGTISGIPNLVDDSHIDLSQALTIDFTPATPSGLGQAVSVQIPAAGPSPAFTIGPGITGNWYNASQSGHGFSIEVLPGNVMLAEWYVFGPQGGRDWVVATGPITGKTAVLRVAQTSGTGGRFPPNFDPTQIQNQLWGTITFTFTDCNKGTASWQPVVAGYTSGSIPITRLTVPAGLSCP